jgi:XTP/dITP diphosphohydrolase
VILPRLFEGPKLLIATHNLNKVREFRDLLATSPRARREPFDLLSAQDLNLPEPIETGTTFFENARLKARLAAKASGLPAMADDSGLAIEALGGDPGVYSARWAGPEKNFLMAIQKIRAQTRGVSSPARFVTCLTLAWPNGDSVSVEATSEGRTIFPGRGTKGFHYDPIFIPDGYTKSFGEMDAAEKHRLSARGKAVKLLLAACFRA